MKMNALTWLLRATIITLFLFACRLGEVNLAQTTPTSLPPPTITTSPPPTSTTQPTATQEQPSSQPTMPPATSQPTMPPATPIPTVAISGEALVLVRRAEAALRRLDTLTVTRLIIIESDDLYQTERHLCMMQLPDNLHCTTYRNTNYTDPTTEDKVVDYEYLQRGINLWTRNEGDEAWAAPSRSAINYLEAQLAQIQMSDYVVTAVLGEEAIIDNVPVYQVRMTLEPASIIDVFFADIAYGDSLSPSENDSFALSLWLGQEDNIIRKAVVNLQFQEENGTVVTLSMQSYLSDINQPVIFPDPGE